MLNLNLDKKVPFLSEIIKFPLSFLISIFVIAIILSIVILRKISGTYYNENSQIKYIFPAERLSSDTGKKEKGYIAAYEGQSKKGILLYGPGIPLKKGYYKAILYYTSDISATLEIHYRALWRNIAEGELKPLNGGFIEIPFFVSDELDYKEMNLVIYYPGKGNIRIEKLVIERSKIQRAPFLSINIVLFISLLLVPILLFLFHLLKNKYKISLKSWKEGSLIIAFAFPFFPSVFEAFLFLSLLLSIIEFIKNRKNYQAKIEKGEYLLFAFVFFSLISGILSYRKLEGIGASFLFLMYILIYYYFKTQDWNEKFFKLLIKTLSISIISWSTIALIHFFLVKIPIALTWENNILSIFPSGEGKDILVSFFQHASMGTYLISLFTAFLCYFTITNFKWKFPFRLSLELAAIIMALVILYLTGGRGGRLFLSIFLFASVLFLRKWYAIGGILVLIAGLLFIPNEKIKKTLNSLTNPLEISNLEGRIEQYSAGWKLFKKQKIFGIGLANFGILYKTNFPDNYQRTPVAFLHNGYLSILVETGISGFILFFGFIIWLLYKYLKSFLEQKEKPFFLPLGAGFLAGFLIISFFDAMQYNVPLGVLLWIGFGISLNEKIKLLNKNKSGERIYES